MTLTETFCRLVSRRVAVTTMSCTPLSPLLSINAGVPESAPRAELPLGIRKYQHFAVHETEAYFNLASSGCSVRRPEPDGMAQLRCLIAAGVTSQADIARRLGLSVATLRRRLAQQGITFRDISRDVRADRLKQMPASGMPLDDIAGDLGLSDRRSLRRACHDWLAMSPAAYRATHHS